MTRDRLTALAAWAVGLAAGAACALWWYNSLWVQSAGNPMALDANENLAALAWVVGWLLIACAACLSAVVLVRAIRRSASRRPILDSVALGVTLLLLVGAVMSAPLWGSASG